MAAPPGTRAGRASLPPKWHSQGTVRSSLVVSLRDPVGAHDREGMGTTVRSGYCRFAMPSAVARAAGPQARPTAGGLPQRTSPDPAQPRAPLWVSGALPSGHSWAAACRELAAAAQRTRHLGRLQIVCGLPEVLCAFRSVFCPQRSPPPPPPRVRSLRPERL